MADSALKTAKKIFSVFDGSPEKFWDFLQVLKAARSESVASGNAGDYDPDADGMSAGMRTLHLLNMEMQPKIREAMKNGGDVSRLYDCYRESLLFSAPWYFEQFMLFMELDRPPKDKFYAPRQKTFKKHGFVQAMQALEDGELDELFLSCPPRVGKALANDTPVLTRKGWKKHGDLVVGDEVIGLDGRFKKVIAVHPKCELDVMVEFSNGEKIQCHENHEWLLYDHQRKKNTLRETWDYEQDWIESGEPGKRGHRYRFLLPKRGYIEGEHKDLPLDPYTLGVWLGDGTNKNPTISNPDCDKAIIDRIARNGNAPKWETRHKTTGVMYYGFGFREALQSMGMCHSRRALPKHIPDKYMTASIEQRLDLLAGLLDTDGTYTRREKRYHYTTVDEALRDGFIELVSTFGWRASVTAHEPCVSSSGVCGRKTVYDIGFCPDCVIPCELERKRNAEFAKKRGISLKSITRVEPKEGNCITVEGDGMYLAGKTLVPTHNTTLVRLFNVWEAGKHPNRSNLYSVFSDTVARSYYSGILEFITDTFTYNFNEVFPGTTIVSKNAQDLTVNLGRKTVFPTITARSIEGALNGSCDCNNLLLGDDLLEGIEEAMSKDRLIKKWSKVDNNLLTRAKEGCKFLWIGTRWSLLDPIGIRLELLERDEKYKNRRYKVINIPALDENDESNFDYDYGVGFSTEYFQQRRASFEHNNDVQSWLAQYMGQPVERSGMVFAPGEFRFYNGVLPEEQPVRRFMCVDPAFGGGDFVAAAACIMYANDDIYIPDVVYSNEMKDLTMPMLANLIKQNKIEYCEIEANKTLESYVLEFQQLLRDNGIRCTVTSKPASTRTSKHERIKDKSSDIKAHMIFLEANCRRTHYQKFMDNVYGFRMLDDKQHDDAPDCLAMSIASVFHFNNNYAYAFTRRF